VARSVEWINARGPYSVDEVTAMRRQIQHHLVSRLRIALDRKTFNGIADYEVRQPIFVIGFARSGTTLLHALLAEDPDALAPLAWHSRWPSPPPGAGPVCKGRIAYAQRDVEHWIDMNPAPLILHPYADMGAYQYIEDEEILTLDFRNAYPSLMYRVPTLDVNVTIESDAAGTVAFHKHFVQHLMWNAPKTRWVSKYSTAQFHMDELFKAYPDALCVWAHRPLSEIYASNVTVRAATFDQIRGEPMDWTSQARSRAEMTKEAVDRMMASSIIDDPRIVHIPFQDLSKDPVGTIKTIYARRGAEFTPSYEQRICAWLDHPENRVDRYGRYPYAYEPLGLDKAWIEGLFADYSRKFGLVKTED
jgi:hypothetical protein